MSDLLNLPKDNGAAITLGLVGAVALAGTIVARKGSANHLVKGEEAKWSSGMIQALINDQAARKAGWTTAKAKKARYVVTAAYPKSYNVTEVSTGRKLSVADWMLVAADSKTRDWPGTGYEGVKPKGSRAVSKSLKKRIELANRYIDWAVTNDVRGTGYFGSTWPVVIEYTEPIKLTHGNNRATVRYNELDGSKLKPYKEVYGLNDEERVGDLRHEISTYIIKAIKNGAKDDGLKIPSFK